MIELPTPDEYTLGDVAQGLKIGQYVDHRSEPLEFDVAALGTAGLWRVFLRGEQGQASAVVKVLRHPAKWPVLAELAPPVQEFFLRTFPWSQDPDVLSEVAARCPEGLRTVTLLGTQWHGSHMRSMWLEDHGDVHCSPPQVSSRMQRACWASCQATGRQPDRHCRRSSMTGLRCR